MLGGPDARGAPRAARGVGNDVLGVHGLSVRYGRAVRALEDVHIEVPGGGVLAVLGGDGAGKSTLLRAVSGTLRLHHGSVVAGRIVVDDRRIDRLGPARAVRAGVVAVPQGRPVFARMTVGENLRAGGLGARSARSRRGSRRRVLALLPGLAERAGQRAGSLSAGDQQLLAIARALMTGPRLLLLDEPSQGLSPQEVGRVADVVRRIHEQGTGVVLVEQDATTALGVADRAVVLEGGRITRSGSVAELLAGADVPRLPLGGPGGTPAAGPGEGPSRAPADGRPRRLWRWAG